MFSLDIDIKRMINAYNKYLTIKTQIYFIFNREGQNVLYGVFFI